MPAMFKILGGDGKEYGPVTADQIRQWIGEGRANHATMAKTPDDISWKPLAEHAEFAELFGAKPPAVAPPPAGAAAVPPAPAAPVTTPVPAAGPAASDARAKALSQVSGPAIALLITAILGIAMNVLALGFNFVGRGFMPMYGMNPDFTRMLQMLNGPWGSLRFLFPVAIGVLVLVGALKMQKLASHGLATTAAILAMIPCLSPCCLLGLPFGIWALVVLNKPEVRAQFDR